LKIPGGSCSSVVVIFACTSSEVFSSTFSQKTIENNFLRLSRTQFNLLNTTVKGPFISYLGTAQPTLSYKYFLSFQNTQNNNCGFESLVKVDQG
jgi:hypothetical protein